MKKIAGSLALFFLAACSAGPPDVSHYPKAPFKNVKIGKPYKIRGKWYSPHYDPTYEEEGVASWYGPNFHGKSTANGERFNQYAYTAAHTTLPMPSIVRVTNLENGRAMNLRVNDRGPFHDNRIIDLSRAAAEKLGVIASGTARVRVEYLKAETERYIASRGREGDELQFAANYKPYRSPYEQDLIPDIHDEGIKRAAPITMVRTEVIAQPLQSYENQRQPIIVPTSNVTEQSVYNLPTWLVQVASYSDTVNAERMMYKLKGLGMPMLQEVGVGGRKFFRILLRPHHEEQNQQLLLTQLEQRFGIEDAKVISR